MRVMEPRFRKIFTLALAVFSVMSVAVAFRLMGTSGINEERIQALKNEISMLRKERYEENNELLKISDKIDQLISQVEMLRRLVIDNNKSELEPTTYSTSQ